jgi:anti-sigma regulatory factor (Ser/Thr protein kinase)
VARYFDCDEETVDDIKLAISEACTNAVKAKDGSVPVGIFVHPADSNLEFEVVDSAGGFDETTITPSEQLEEGGIGLQIIKSLFPQAVVEPNPNGGTTVRFAVDCSSAPRTGADGAP